MSTFIRSRDLYLRIGEKTALRASHHGWIKPVQSKPRYTIWAVDDIDRLESRIALGEFPPLLPSEVEAEERRKTKALFANKTTVCHQKYYGPNGL